MLFDIKDVKNEKDACNACDDLIDEAIEIKGMNGRRRVKAVNRVSGDLDQLKAKSAMRGWKVAEHRVSTALSKLQAQNQKEDPSRNVLWDIVG